MAGEEEEEAEEVINEAAIITGACLRQLLEDGAHTHTHTLRHTNYTHLFGGGNLRRLFKMLRVFAD